MSLRLEVLQLATDFSVWLGAFLTIGAMSFVFFKENPVFDLVVNVFLGIGIGHGLVLGIGRIVENGWKPMLQGQYILIVPLVAGVLLFMRRSKKYARLAKPSAALLVSVAAALSLRGSAISLITGQIKATFVPLTSLSNIVLVLSVVGPVAYFLFTRRYADKLVGPLKYLPVIGRWSMMVCFGAGFANTTGFFARLIVRFLFLLRDWLGLIS